MNWINIETHRLRAPEYIGSEPKERATWLNLLGFCCEQENSGIISDCKAWKDRMWQQVCGVLLKEVQAETSLWSWDGDDLILWGYPQEKESEVRGKRLIARENGKRGGRPATKQQTDLETNVGLPDGSDAASDVAKRKGREGKGMEEKGREGNDVGSLPAPLDMPLETSDDIVAAIRAMGPRWSKVPEGPIVSAFSSHRLSPANRAKAVKAFLEVHAVVADEDLPPFPLAQFKGYLRKQGEIAGTEDKPVYAPLKRFSHG
jgi:hypothetical protein